MIVPQINRLQVTNFRSIRGTIDVPMDPGITLVHGTNGAGKTSLLSAIELSLTGNVPSLSRLSPQFLKSLVHQGSEGAEIRIEVSGLQSPNSIKHDISVANGKLHGGALLDHDSAQSFTERSYLAQSTLSRLLEMYEASDKKGDSLLTRFVNELLGLEQLDALIEGLEAASDIRRTKKLIPEFDEHALREKNIESRLVDAEIRERKLRNDYLLTQRKLKALATVYDSALSYLDDTKLSSEIERLVSNDGNNAKESQLFSQRIEISNLLLQLRELPHDTISDLVASENMLQPLRRAAQEWDLTYKGAATDIIARLPAPCSRLLSSWPINMAATWEQAMRLVQKEINKHQAEIRNQERLQVRADVARNETKRTESELYELEERIASFGERGEAGSLSRLLSELLPHVSSDICPVCSRDYSEMAAGSLVNKLEVTVGRLTNYANELQSLIDQRDSLTADLLSNRLTSRDPQEQLLGDADRAELTSRTAELSALLEVMSHLQPNIMEGDKIHADLLAGQRDHEFQTSKNRLETSLIKKINTLAASSNRNLPASSSPIAVAEEMLNRIEDELQEIQERSLQLRNLQDHVAVVREAREHLDAASKFRKDLNTKLDALKLTTAEVGDRVRAARTLANAAVVTRKKIVGKVFNETLNQVWRDLFIRLAPNEPFVPTFHVSDSPGQSTAAQLRTVYRSGELSGSPSSILSAGNLNTAALTLFLALHLTAGRKLPWLILDDPVQSMDDVHIAQFAALLRSLAQGHSRQVVVAVHERSLFDYLSLELSPALPGQILTTVELSRKAVGATVARVNKIGWEADRAIVA